MKLENKALLDRGRSAAIIEDFNDRGALTIVPVYDLRGLASSKPLAVDVAVGSTYWSVDTDPSAAAIEVSNGTTWVVM